MEAQLGLVSEKEAAQAASRLDGPNFEATFYFRQKELFGVSLPAKASTINDLCNRSLQFSDFNI